MDDMEKLKRAQMYLNKLANGIDPITGKEIESDAMLNNVRLSRCFFYVAEVLGQVIAAGGVSPPAGKGNIPFMLDASRLDAVPISDTPLTVTQFCRNITQAAAAQGKLSFQPITNWLLTAGYLENEARDGNKTRRRVTAKGREIGLSEEQRDSQDGRYLAILYSPAAQRFILEHLAAILG